MKQLPIKSEHFRYVIESFRQWLDILGYAPTSVYGMPNAIRELLHYMESQGFSRVDQIDNKLIKDHYYKLKGRKSTVRGGGLSAGHLNKHLQAIHKFCDYLRQTGRLMLPKLSLDFEEVTRQMPDVLTPEEVMELYLAADKYPTPHERIAPWLYEALAKRDKAMLSIFYGAGLRRNEGVQLNVSDFYPEKGLLHIRAGKNYKEGLVPLGSTAISHIQDYLYESRPHFIRNNKEDMFFTTQRGNRINGQTLLVRLKLLADRSENEELKQKEFGLHTLRHSIATHLLQNGMSLESIGKFLRHSSLESTQIYTHLIEKDDDQ